MKNKIVISIGSLLACIASIAVLIAAVGPPPILRNSMTTNQNVWEKSGSSMTWTGNVAVAGTVSASVATNATNVVTLGQMSPGSDTQVIFRKGTTNGTDSDFIWDYTNHRLGIGRFPEFALDILSGSFLGRLRIAEDSDPSIVISNSSSGVNSKQYEINSRSDRLNINSMTDAGAGIATLISAKLPNGGIGINTVGQLSMLDVNGGVAIGTYAGSVAAPANGLIVSGQLGIGISNPVGKLQISKPSTTTTLYRTNSYLNLSDGYFQVGELRLISFGFDTGTQDFYPAYIGYIETDTAGYTTGDLIFGTRSLISDTAPIERVRITSSGLLTNSVNIATAGHYESAGSVGISTSEKVITQAGTTNLNVWVGGILVSNITNYHD